MSAALSRAYAALDRLEKLKNGNIDGFSDDEGDGHQAVGGQPASLSDPLSSAASRNSSESPRASEQKPPEPIKRPQRQPTPVLDIQDDDKQPPSPTKEGSTAEVTQPLPKQPSLVPQFDLKPSVLKRSNTSPIFEGQYDSRVAIATATTSTSPLLSLNAPNTLLPEVSRVDVALQTRLDDIAPSGAQTKSQQQVPTARDTLTVSNLNQTTSTITAASSSEMDMSYQSDRKESEEIPRMVNPAATPRGAAKSPDASKRLLVHQWTPQASAPSGHAARGGFSTGIAAPVGPPLPQALTQRITRELDEMRQGAISQHQELERLLQVTLPSAQKRVEYRRPDSSPVIVHRHASPQDRIVRPPVGAHQDSVDIEMLIRNQKRRGNAEVLSRHKDPFFDRSYDGDWRPIKAISPPRQKVPPDTRAGSNAKARLASPSTYRFASPTAASSTKVSKERHPYVSPITDKAPRVASKERPNRTPPANTQIAARQRRDESATRQKHAAQNSSLSPVRLSPPSQQPHLAPRSNVKVSKYTRMLLKEHEQRRKQALEHLAAQPHTDKQRSASRQNRSTERTDRKKSLSAEAERHHRSRVRGSSNIVSQDQWLPLANRHAVGASLILNSSAMSSFSARSAPTKSANSSALSHTPQTRQHAEADDTETNGMDVSPFSPVQHTTNYTTTTSGSFLAGFAASPSGRNELGGGTMPLLQYLIHMTSGNISFLQTELHDMRNHVVSDGLQIQPETCRDWAALTALSNQRVCVETIVVPLLLSELTDKMNLASEGSAAASSEVSHLLCAIAGLGNAAKAALQPLLEMLEDGFGHPGLVGLAIRAVGSDDGLCALCSVAQKSRDPRTQCAALYALGLLPSAVQGHTSIICLGLVKLKGKKMFYQPRVSGSDGSPAASNRIVGSPEIPVVGPPYRPTHVFIDAETMRKKLSQFTMTATYSSRRHEPSHVSQVTVLRDLFLHGPYACSRLDTSPVVHEHLASVSDELRAVLLDDVSSRDLIPVLENSYEALCDEHFSSTRVVTLTVMNLLRAESTVPSVSEQALVTIAALPKRMTDPVVEGLVEYITTLVKSFTQSTKPSTHEGRIHQTVAAAVISLGSIVNPAKHSQGLVDSATAIAVHLLDHTEWKLRHAACLALGSMGPISSNAAGVVKIVVENLQCGNINADTGCWCLSKSGRHGVACLVDTLGYNHVSSGLRIAAAIALGYLDPIAAADGDPKKGADVHLAVEKGLQRCVLDNMVSSGGEALAIACINAIAKLDSPLTKEAAGRSDEEASARVAREPKPNPVFQALIQLVDVAAKGASRTAVLRAMLHALCEHGGSHGEYVVTTYAAKGDRPEIRSAAVYALRAAGGACCRAVALSLNDGDVEVRQAALETLEQLSVDEMMRVLQTRPSEHAEQVQKALNDALHRDLGAGTSSSPFRKSGSAGNVKEWLKRIEQMLAHATSSSSLF